MEVNAVYVEQVIIGLFVIVTVSFLLTGGLPVTPAGIDDNVAVAAMIAVAYVVGILYDRISDSMLTTVAAYGKIAFGVRHRKPVLPEQKRYIVEDPIPEYSQRLIATPPSQLYVLSRMRLLRATTSLIPAMTVAWCVRGTGSRYVLLGVTAVYVFYAWLATKWEVPQTNRIVEVNDFLHTHVRIRPEDGRMEVSLWGVLSYWPVLIVLAIAAVAAIVWRQYAVEIAAGVFLTLLTGWAWLRVADTHMRLVKTAVKHKVTA